MFENVCLKSSTNEGQRVDIAFLVDSMIYYQKVTILVHVNELERLIFRFGDQLKFFIEIGRLDIQVKTGMIGTMDFSTPKQHYFGVNIMGKKDETVESILYQAHRLRVNNSTKNMKFVDEYIPVVTKFQYNDQLKNHILSDFLDKDFIKSSFKNYMSIIYPDYKFNDDFHLEMNKDGKFQEAFDKYSLNSNIDLVKVNNEFKESTFYKGYDISFLGFLHALSETRGDTFIAADLESEIVTSDLYSKLMQLQLNKSIQRRLKSQNEIDEFQEYAIKEVKTVGDAFSKGLIMRKELIKLLEEGVKFRDWVGKIKDDKSLIGEYHKEVLNKSVLDKLPGKTARFVFFEGVGIIADIMGAGGAGKVAATGLAGLDTFYLDKLIKGWRPNQYIDNSIIPLVSRKDYTLYT